MTVPVAKPAVTESAAVRYPGMLALFAVWTAIGLLAFMRHYLGAANALNQPMRWAEVATFSACFYSWIVLTPLVFQIERRFPLGRKQWLRNLLVLGASSVVLSYIALLLLAGLFFVIDHLAGRPATITHAWWKIERAEFCFEEFVFWSTVGGSYVIRHFARLREQELRSSQLALEKSELEASLQRAELEALRMRLNPHFLFNTLQNISVLTQEEPKIASQMLVRLGDLLRAALKGGTQPEVSLDVEIAQTEAYLAIEKMRLGERLTVNIEVAFETRCALVPTLLLQPLVENAIIHGLRGIDFGRIDVISARTGDQLLLLVIDNGRGVPDELDYGIGLGSTVDRLKRMYPEGHEFSIRRLPQGGSEVRIAIPFRQGILPIVPREAEEDEQHALANR